ncbi:hypothetical protein MNQ96_04460 [Sphingopyxis granuli]|uniref:hypothetical protein n=1 Tax=Sphingopyxis granuli TaxID=267128 RepID=UPI001F53A599|nr:hypothetical protein [Sphingopyxis granuli]UNK81425.1 hypothetical protein MNQ96_04460 [Sphingopyxis granuli]
MPATSKHIKTAPSRSALLILIVANFSSRSSRYTSDTKTVDPKLVTLIAKAHRARADLFSGAASRGNRHIERLARLAYLAPDITAAILEDDQPRTLTSRKLLKRPALPLGWDEQRRVLRVYGNPIRLIRIILLPQRIGDHRWRSSLPALPRHGSEQPHPWNPGRALSIAARAR